jgi:hypothetical protein
MHETETVPSCVTSYVYFHRSWSGRVGFVVLLLGWLVIAAAFFVGARGRRSPIV